MTRGLAAFYAGFDVGIGSGDQGGEGFGVDGSGRFEFYVSHEFAGALEQAGWVGERGSMKETDVHMRSEYVDVAEGRIS